MALAPARLRRVLEDGLRRWQVKRASDRLTSASSTDYNLLRAVMNGKFADVTGIGDAAGQGALRKLSIGGLWTRHQLCAIGRATSELCAHCGQQPDTPGHRWWKCVGTRVARQGHPEAAALSEAVSELVLEGQLFAFAQPLLYDLVGETTYGQEVFDEGCLDAQFQGHVFLDGSGFFPREARLRRCGWSAVLLNQSWDMERVLFGPLPLGPQTVPHSEHYAFAMALDHIVADTVLYTDCQGVMDYYLMGAAACSSKMLFAGIWRRIFARLSSLRARGISVNLVKVSAHQDSDFLEQGSDMKFQAVGNNEADKWAKKGALSHILPEAVIDDFMRHREQNLQVMGAVAALWIFTLKDGSWINPDDAKVEPPPPPPKAPTAEGPRLVVVHHQMVRHEWGEQCRVCRRWARPGPHLDRLLGLACTPLAPSDDTSSRVHSSHVIQTHRSGIIWCRACDTYADRLLRSLGVICNPHPTRSGTAVIRAMSLGIHPRTGRSLDEALVPGA